MNQIKVYASEIQEGISERIINNNTVAFDCVVLPSDKVDTSIPEKIIASLGNPNQPDLYYLKSILASTGWNNNDDYFSRANMLLARNTPVDKQFNYMHNEKDIIGHITGSYIVDDNNVYISDEDLDKFENFNIATSAVIYRSWTDKELRERCEKIIAGIESGDWFVSMECIFYNFDYILTDSLGEEKVIARNEDTSHMSKFLRAYGGTGVYQDCKIGRVLDKFVFSGKGLVNKPANKKSLITETQGSGNPNEDEIKKEESLAGEKYKMEELQKEVDALKAQLSIAQASIKDLTEFKTKSEALELSEKELKSQAELSKSEIETLKSELSSVKSEKEKVLAELNTLLGNVKLEKRKAALIEAEVDAEDLEASIASFANLDDEAFDKVVALFKKGKKEKKDESKDTSKEEKSDATILVVETEKTKASLNDVSSGSDVKNDMSKRFGQMFHTTRK